MRVEKTDVKIEGYPGLFTKVVELNRRSRVFSINYPKKKVLEDIVEVESVYAASWKEAEELWRQKIVEFELINQKFELVICYNIESKGNHFDGSGEGFIFSWGVFKMIKPEHSHRELFYLAKSCRGKKNIDTAWNQEEKYSRMKWTQEREDFFNSLSDGIEQLYKQLYFFCNSVQEHENVPAQLLEAMRVKKQFDNQIKQLTDGTD